MSRDLVSEVIRARTSGRASFAGFKEIFREITDAGALDGGS
jgi:hypothetical protein